MGPIWGETGHQSSRQGREHCRYLGGKRGIYEGENSSKGTLRNGLNDKRGNRCRILQSKHLDGSRERKQVRKLVIWGDATEAPEMVSVADSNPIHVEGKFKPKQRCVRPLVLPQQT